MIDPLEVVSYDKPWWLKSILLTSRITSHETVQLESVYSCGFFLVAAIFLCVPTTCGRKVWHYKPVVPSTHAQLQISLSVRCFKPIALGPFSGGVYRLLVRHILSNFLLAFQNIFSPIKIMFPCILFPIRPYPPKTMKKTYSIRVNCIGWQVCLYEPCS